MRISDLEGLERIAICLPRNFGSFAHHSNASLNWSACVPCEKFSARNVHASIGQAQQFSQTLLVKDRVVQIILVRFMAYNMVGFGEDVTARLF
jgi:hypothetical protein